MLISFISDFTSLSFKGVRKNDIYYWGIQIVFMNFVNGKILLSISLAIVKKKLLKVLGIVLGLVSIWLFVLEM